MMSQCSTSSRFDRKLARMREGVDGPEDFILADAKDADMAGGLSSFGTNRVTGRACTLPEFDAAIEAIIRQDVVDILLASVSTLCRLTRKGLFEQVPIRQAVRFNDTTDLWRVRGATYTRQAPIAFATARLALSPAQLGLYSMTFTGDAQHDAMVLAQYRNFREEAQALGLSHFLEVFNPTASALNEADYGPFLNDMISRALAGMEESERPVFLKLAYNGYATFEAFCRYDPSLVVGIMGGGSGTTRDCLELLHQAQRGGARAALFGRKILDAEDPPLMVEMMRAVTDLRLTPSDAVNCYHEALAERGIAPRRSRAADLEITDPVLKAG